MAKRKLYSETLKEVSDNATLFYVKSRKLIEPGWIRYVVFATAYDNTTSGRNIEFGKLVDGKFHSMEGTDAGAKSIPSWFAQRTHVFLRGEIPAFRFTDATVNDELLGYMEGYEVEIEEVVSVG